MSEKFFIPGGVILIGDHDAVMEKYPDARPWSEWVEPEPESLGWVITQLAFRNRFTVAEKTAIELAQIDDPNGSTQSRQTAAIIRVFAADLNAATYVDLEYEPLIDGVNMLSSIGILTEERVAEILTTPVQSHEL